MNCEIIHAIREVPTRFPARESLMPCGIGGVMCVMFTLWLCRLPRLDMALDFRVWEGCENLTGVGLVMWRANAAWSVLEKVLRVG
jgi:hypothetical protein